MKSGDLQQKQRKYKTSKEIFFKCTVQKNQRGLE